MPYTYVYIKKMHHNISIIVQIIVILIFLLKKLHFGFIWMISITSVTRGTLLVKFPNSCLGILFFIQAILTYDIFQKYRKYVPF